MEAIWAINRNNDKPLLIIVIINRSNDEQSRLIIEVISPINIIEF
jgi:hypothetical protein